MKFYYTKRWLILLFVLMLFIFPYANEKPSSVNASNEFAKLGNQISTMINDKKLEGAFIGISLRTASNGEIIYENLGDKRLRPASNMKLLTAAAALETLGENYQFTTEIRTDGEIKGKTLAGNLYLKGKGDPTLLKDDFDMFASILSEKGIKNINGNLIGDDTWYDNVRLSQDLTWTDETEYYGAQVSALTVSPNEDYDAGTVIVEVKAADSPDQPVEWTLLPKTDHVQIINQAVTTEPGSPKNIMIKREHGTNNIVISGTMPIGSSNSKEWMSVLEPGKYALDIFRHSLLEKGIKIGGNSQSSMGEVPKNSSLLAEKHSPLLKEIMVPFMKLSNNGHAEMLAKEMGKVVHDEGSWDKGLEVINQTAAKLGVNTKTIELRDASGISHVTTIPANEITTLLYTVQNKKWFPSYLNSLPIAGESERFVGGTLRNRMKNPPTKGNVTAKTGSLTGVSTLSGYATTKNGEKIIFSIMINNYLASGITDIQDKIATAIAGYDSDN